MLALAFLLAFPVELEPDSGLFANTFYHVICLAGEINCSHDKIQRFWQDELGWDEEDEEALGSLKSILKRIGDSAPDPEPVAVPPNFSGYYPGYRARYSLLSLIVESGSSPAIAEAVADSLTGENARRLSAAFGHFEARLRPWWESRAPESAHEHGLKVLREIESAGLGDLSDQLAGFMQARLARAGLHAVTAPYPGEGALATIMGRHLFIEFSSDDTPTDGAWKVLHELTHILYDEGSIKLHQDLVTQFLEADQPHSMAHYALLNEGIATALQLLAFERLNVEMEDFYDHPYIPRLALSTQPLLRKALAAGSTLHAGFAEQYMLAADAELGDEVLRPQYMLLGVGVLGTERHPDAAEAYFELIPPVSATTSEENARVFFEVNVVQLLTHDELEMVSEWLPGSSHAAQHRGFAYSPSATSKRRVYLISGQSEQDLVEAVTKFAELDDVTPAILKVRGLTRM